MHKPTLAAVLLVVALCACSGDDDDVSDDPATTEVSDPPTVTTQPVDVTDATDSPTTTDPTTTTNTSMTTSTTVAAPTVEEQIATDYQLIYDGYWACLRAPLNCDMSWLVSGSGSEQAMINTMQALVDRGRYVGEEDPGYYVIESITVGADGTTAEVMSCWRLTGVLYGPPVDDSSPVGPDNPATLVNNTPGSGRQRDSLVRSAAGRWQVETSDVSDSQTDVNQCAAET